MIEQFTTRRETPGRRLDYWNRVVGETYDGLLVDADNRRFDASMLRWRLGDMTMIWPQSCGATVRRRREVASRCNDQRLVVHIAQAASPELTERGRTMVLRPGDMVVCAAEEAYEWRIGDRHEMLVIELDRARLSDRLPDRLGAIDDRIARVIPRERPTTRLLHRFVLSLWREGGTGLDPVAAQAYADSLGTMIAASLGGDRSGENDDAAGEPALIARMHAAIAALAAEPALSPARLAGELGVSLRTLQAAAANAGTTPRHAITAHRLRLAAEELRLHRDAPITGIALDCGFADSAHFARRFQERYGMSPSEFRRAG